MYDSGKIIIGLIIFAGIFTSPFWYDLSGGKEALKAPVLVLPTKADQQVCVNTLEYMRADHMVLLNDWRYEVVRLGDRTYQSPDHKEFNMSLTGTCLNCHANSAQFCDQCHSYIGETPYCWECHTEINKPENMQ